MTLGVRVVSLRTGVLLDHADGALARMLPPFRLGLGGPVAGGDQYISWIAPDDLVRLYLAALDNPAWSGPVNATAPEPVTNREFAHALGRVLHRPARAADPRVSHCVRSTARWRASSPQGSVRFRFARSSAASSSGIQRSTERSRRPYHRVRPHEPA